jgi:HK97 family phage portal protein
MAGWLRRQLDHENALARQSREQRDSGSPTVMGTHWSNFAGIPFNLGSQLAFPEISQDRVLSLSAVFSAVRLLAGSVSTLPIKAYRRSSKDRLPLDQLPMLFDNLITDGQIVTWLHRCMTSLALRGNAFGLVTGRDNMGYPTSMTWLNPADMQDDRNIANPSWWWRGRPIPSEDLLHIPWFPIAERVQGLSPIAAFASTFGIGLSAREYGSGWFNSGGVPSSTFQNTEQALVSQEVASAVKARLVNAIRTRQPLVYGKDWEFQTLSVSLQDAQFLETIKATTNQVAAIYSIPADMIGGETGSSNTYANVEQQQINFVMFTLRPWVVMLENAFSALLPDHQYIRFNVDALFRADALTRHEVYKIDRSIGLYNIDELRAFEDQPPLPNGKGQDYTPLPVPASTPKNANDQVAAGTGNSSNGQASKGTLNSPKPTRQFITQENGETR